MGVADKTRVLVGGVPLLDRTLRALTGAEQVVVVGEPRATALDVAWSREDPVGGGPAAALAAGLAHVTAEVVVLLAADLPLITREDVEGLVVAVTGDGAVYLDDVGREQWLCSAWRSASLRDVPLVAEAPIGRVLRGLDFARVTATASALDCDTPEDLVRVEERLT
jgi:molybdopterin-guanine dinucleotide biosynthesis protein A